jgi:hypothetical protein
MIIRHLESRNVIPQEHTFVVSPPHCQSKTCKKKDWQWAQSLITAHAATIKDWGREDKEKVVFTKLHFHSGSSTGGST